MPTPVKTAKQCLNAAASNALEEAVTVARRRGHAQTTSLHAVSAFLSLSPSQLREACVRAKNTAFYPKVQLKALDFCLSVSLERLPISQPRVDEPKISNSLMAAIKRSQANQRRHPDSLITVKNHPLGHCNQEQSGSTSSGVKVELHHLIVSILDDPIISRVFNDAGFSSFDVKLALLRPFQGYFSRYPPSVLGVFPDPGNRRFRFPFSGYGDEEGDYRRIGEVLVRKKGRNPLLVGVSANDALKGFVEVLERRRDSGFLPLEIKGINVISIEKDILKFITENSSHQAMDLRLREMDMMVQQCLGPGLMVSFGNLRCFLGGESGCVMDVVNFVVGKLTKLFKVHDSRVWLIGYAANDQMYMEFLHRFPSIDKDWDLQPLPITSVRASLGESCLKSSLMGSFVPLGGFFSPPDTRASFSSSYQFVNRSNMFREKFEEEITSTSKSGCMALVANNQQSSRSPWLQMAERGASNMLDSPKAKGGKVWLSPPVAALRSKQAYLCQYWNLTQLSHKPEVGQDSLQLPTGSHCLEEKVKNISNENSCSTSTSCKELDYGRFDSCTPVVLHNHSTSESSKPVFLRSLESDIFPTKLSESPPRTEHPLAGGSSSPYSLCISGVDDGQTSPSSVVSVATDLGLELFSQSSKKQKKADEQCANNSEALFKALFARVGRQCEALKIISQIVTECWTSNGSHQKSGLRGDIWLNFMGPDIFGKRKIALALAEILYGSKENFIHVDLYSRNIISHQKTVFGYQIGNGSEARSRGKTIVDHIAEELRKTPSCVVLFANVHFADALLQRSLLQAIKDGKFSDSYGREVATNNRIFVLTLKIEAKNLALSLKEKSLNFPEERIGRAKGWPLQIIIKGVEDYSSNSAGKKFPCQFLNKRKLNGTDEKTEQYISLDHVKQPNKESKIFLDLNLPAETKESDDMSYEDPSVSLTSEAWLEEFLDQLRNNLVKLVFDPFDYDALAAKILKLVHASFNEVIDRKCILEIEPRVMDQIIAVACLSDRDKQVEDWIEQVLRKGFAEVQKNYQLTACSTVMIVTCEALCVEEQVREACLPSKIFLN